MTIPKSHPVAALFPMMADDEIQDLVKDITTRGQLQPIILDTKGRILDGRNRAAACDIAKIEPWVETYDGDDPDGYALAVNIQRRSLTKGQAAMIAARAMIVSETKTEGRSVAKATGTSGARISQAKTVLEFAPDLVDAIIAGAGTTLDKAYEIAKRRKQDAASDETKLEQVRSADPALADKVTEEELSLEAALEEVRQRKLALQRDIEQAEDAANRIVPDFKTHVATILVGTKQGVRGLVDESMLSALSEALNQLKEAAQ